MMMSNQGDIDNHWQGINRHKYSLILSGQIFSDNVSDSSTSSLHTCVRRNSTHTRCHLSEKKRKIPQPAEEISNP